MNSNPGLRTMAVSIPQPRSPDHPMRAFLAIPAVSGPFPGVVIIHEILGLNDNIRDIAGRFASSGYAALAVDLFSSANRAICMARIFHGLLIRPLNNGVVADLQAALDYLGAFPEVDRTRLGAIGFCMGGSYALQLACTVDGLRAASVFYGRTLARWRRSPAPAQLWVIIPSATSPPTQPASWNRCWNDTTCLTTSRSIRVPATPFSTIRGQLTRPKLPRMPGRARWRSSTPISEIQSRVCSARRSSIIR